ncbi:MAG: hypothetical protein OEY49_19875, partial [Candidatus Heimdallarchaeota archaeon]|nr:hypothetical protein [Candidatus Heimdallarchaeota archaeon]
SYFTRRFCIILKILTNRILTNRILTNRILTNRILTNRILTNRVLTNRLISRDNIQVICFSITGCNIDRSLT